MIIWRHQKHRKTKRKTKPQQINFGRNNTGEGGVTYLSWEQPPGTWNYMQPETMQDMHDLVRLVGIMFDNMEAANGTPTDEAKEPGPGAGST